MSPDRDFPTLGPFKCELEIRTAGADTQLPYAFPRLLPMTTSLSDTLMAAPTVVNALTKLEAHRSRATPTPLALATTMPAGALKPLYPGMNLAPVAIVYSLPKTLAPVADQVASQDISEVFGLAHLDERAARVRVCKHIWVPGDRVPTKLFMDLQEYTDIVSQCCEVERGFIGQLVAQIVACEGEVTIGGFFYDRAGLEEHLAGVEHMRNEQLDADSPLYLRALRQAALVGPEPWRHQSWPVLMRGEMAYLLQATLV